MSSDQPRRGIIPRAQDEVLDEDPTGIVPTPQRGTPAFRGEALGTLSPSTPQRAALDPPEQPTAELTSAPPQRAVFPPPQEPAFLAASPHPATSPSLEELPPPPAPATPSYVPTFREQPAVLRSTTPPYESSPALAETPTRISSTPLYRPDAPAEPAPVLGDSAPHADTPTQRLPPHSAEPEDDELDEDELDEPSHSFSNALGWTILGTMFPGVGLVRGGSRFSGIAALVIFLASLVGLGYLAYEAHLAARLIVDPIALIIVATLCGVLAILVTGLVVATYVALRPRTVTVLQRIIGAIVVGVLCFVVTVPLAVVATAGYAQAKLVTLVFRPTESQTRPTITPGPPSDLWANTPRINVLLVGGDEGGTTDTMIVASIDTVTGSTMLITVPRDTSRLPFPTSSPLRTTFPDGYWDSTSAESPDFWANRIMTDLPRRVPANTLGATTSLGADALKLGIGEALGLRVDYYLYMDVASVYTLVDALGGVSMTVGTKIPTDAAATSWIEPGANLHLDAYQAFWYGWSSSGTDADRQSRRVCVIDSMTRKNPAMVLARFDAIAQAGTSARTDIPSSMLPMFVELSTRMKRTHVTSLQFTNGVDGFVTANPDFALMRQRVATAVAGSLDPASAQASTAVSIATQCGA